MARVLPPVSDWAKPSRPIGFPRLIVKTLSCFLAIIVGCATSNLDKRPAWTAPPSQWNRAHTTETGAILAMLPENRFLLQNGVGRAPRGKIEIAKTNAKNNAKESLAQAFLAHVRTSFERTWTYRGSDRRQTFSEEIRSSLQITANSLLSGATVVREWEGFDNDEVVIFCLLALDLPSTSSAIRSSITAKLSAADGFSKEIEILLKQRDFSGIKSPLANLYSKVIDLRALLASYHYVATLMEEADDLREWSPRIGEHEQRTENLVGLFRKISFDGKATTGSQFVRGKDSPVLVVTPRISYSGSNFEIPGSDFLLSLATRGHGRSVVRSNSSGALIIHLPIANDTRRGNYRVEVAPSFCAAHRNRGPDQACAVCGLEQRLSTTLTYMVVSDRGAYDRLIRQADATFEKNDFDTAIKFLEDAKRIEFDDDKALQECDQKIASVGFERAFYNANRLAEKSSFQEALASYRGAESIAINSKWPLLSERARTAGVQCANRYLETEIASGSPQTRERCYAVINALPSGWFCPHLSSAFARLKRQLPCNTCGKSGICPRCRGEKSLVLSCHVCKGSREETVNCNQCDSGFVTCTRCNGMRNVDRERCPRCNGHGRVKCTARFQIFQYFTSCTDGYVYCYCANFYPRQPICPGCNNQRRWTCGECRGSGFVGCSNCRETGSLPTCNGCSDGKNKCRFCIRGRKQITCRECKGAGRNTYWCSECNRSGKCPTCNGAGHRS